MAVAPSTAAEPNRTGPEGPIRTCIGCRQRAAAAELLRVAVTPESAAAGPPVQVVPDPRRRIPGRGAWVHPDQRCVELAERRRAYARALRVPGPVDPAAVGEYVAATGSTGPHPRNPAGDE